MVPVPALLSPFALRSVARMGLSPLASQVQDTATQNGVVELHFCPHHILPAVGRGESEGERGGRPQAGGRPEKGVTEKLDAAPVTQKLQVGEAGPMVTAGGSHFSTITLAVFEQAVVSR